jgi:hypothetical protein
MVSDPGEMPAKSDNRPKNQPSHEVVSDPVRLGNLHGLSNSRVPLESVKMSRPPVASDPNFMGDITHEYVARAEVVAPQSNAFS